MKRDTEQKPEQGLREIAAPKRRKRLQAQKSTFAVIFVIQKGKSRKDGTTPIVARITVNGEMVHFATRIYIHPDRWLPKDYRTVGRSKEEKQVNEMLEELRVLIRRKYDEMLRREEVITAGKLKNAITGLDEKSMQLLELCDAPPAVGVHGGAVSDHRSAAAGHQPAIHQRIRPLAAGYAKSEQQYDNEVPAAIENDLPHGDQQRLGS